MLKDLVNQLLGSRIVISSAPGNGASSFALFMANTILDTDSLVIYYNPTADIDRGFVEAYYPRVFEQAIWLVSPLDAFLEYINSIEFNFDCLIIDPGDTTMVNPEIVPTIGKLKRTKSTFICTSQLRMDPKKDWAPYSTIEKLNAFDNSIWIRNVTGIHPVFNLKYIDVHKEIRSGSNFVMRDIAYYTNEGNIVEVR